jgi:YidC/Oxa1 family membrane protein insertase
MYNLPVLSQLILLLHWVLVTLSGWFEPLGYAWQWGLAIIGLTIIVRLILFPLTWKQFSSAQAMQAIQPQLKELQKKYKNDRQKLQQETMALYQQHRVNPFASCLPIVLQLPVFISLYAAIAGKGPLSAPQYQASVQALYHAPFLWIPELGKPDPYYILLILYVVSQLVSTELMLVNQTDKSQKMIMRAMPIIFVVFLWKFPAGLFVYWVTTNLWTIGQQLLIRRFMKPRTVEELQSRPAKKSRFMEALASAGGQAKPQTREELVAKQRAEKAATGGKDAGKAPAKQGAKAPGKGGQAGAKQGAAKQGAGRQAASRQGAAQGASKAAGGQAADQAAKKSGGQSGGRKPPPGKGKRKQSQQGGGAQSQATAPVAPEAPQPPVDAAPEAPQPPADVPQQAPPEVAGPDHGAEDSTNEPAAG